MMMKAAHAKDTKSSPKVQRAPEEAAKRIVAAVTFPVPHSLRQPAGDGQPRPVAPSVTLDLLLLLQKLPPLELSVAPGVLPLHTHTHHTTHTPHTHTRQSEAFGQRGGRR